MIELRWIIEEWEEYRDGLPQAIKHTEKPVLQFREKVRTPDADLWGEWKEWGEWKDVPVVYIED